MSDDWAVVEEANEALDALLPPAGMTSIPEEPVKPREADAYHAARRARDAALARLREREATAWDFEHKMMERATEAEEKLEAAEADRQIQYDAAMAAIEGRARAEARVAELEEALREIEVGRNQAQRDRARRALALTEEGEA